MIDTISGLNREFIVDAICLSSFIVFLACCAFCMWVDRRNTKHKDVE